MNIQELIDYSRQSTFTSNKQSNDNRVASNDSRTNLSQSSSRSNEESQQQNIKYANFGNPSDIRAHVEILQYNVKELQKTVEELQTTSNYPTIYVGFRNLIRTLINFTYFCYTTVLI